MPGQTRPQTVRSPRGFTLIELVITMALAAVMVTVAVPAMQQLVLNGARASTVNELVASLHLARSTAVKHRTHVVLCPSTNGTACSGSTRWENGWIIFVDRVHDHARDLTEPLIRVRGALERQVTVDSGRRAWIQYQPTGMAYGSTTTFTYCDRRGRGDARAIILSNTGRPRVSETAAGGGALSCPSP